MSRTQTTLFLAAGLWLTAASAAELPAGTVINAGNIDAMLKESFDGQAIADVMPESMQFMIRKYALQIKLKKIQKQAIDPSYYEATQKYAGQVQIDPTTKLLSNYVAGTPFPTIDPANSLAGYMAMWNSFYYFSTSGPSLDGDYDQLLIDGEDGLDQHQTWHFTNLPMVGRTLEPHTLGDGKIAKKEMVYVKAPYDAKGFALLTHRYSDGRLDDTWGYIKSIRRVRRFSSGTWMDPVGGSDLLYDDINAFNANPAWYRDFRYVGRKYVLGMQLEVPQTVRGAPDKAAEFPYIDLNNWPHWNPIQEWGPVLVDVVEAFPPEHHPYSKKVYFISVDYPGFARYMEAYDKGGKLWKVDMLAPGAAADSNGRSWITRYLAHIIDIQREHATVAVGWDVAPATLSPDDVTVDVLSRVAR
ncbi:MAG: DUF1329 domain-containing protein [Immundisolibacter sp.]|uniref:DUF1329 domain-containing protein n=1 Tax=Immundisolibacter sp. TaxID=1934948 RepID=UPI003D0B7588